MNDLLLIAIGAGLVWAIGLLRRRYLSFAAQSPDDYKGSGPDFDIRTHLNGAMICDGVIYGPGGRVSTRFVADFDINWSGDAGVMDEVFRYDDGSHQTRAWRLTVDDDGRIQGKADDIVGVATGRQTGPTVQLRYRIRLPEDSGGHVLDTIDWMYLTPDGVIVNRSQFRKFGVKVAELVATMRPANAPQSLSKEVA